MTTLGAIGAQHLERASKTEFDLIVVGGGITGCWATLLAAQRGLKVCLVESGDFGSGTSRVSHRILHGGFRYLQKMDLPRLRESVAERRYYFREFPDLVEPLACLMPLYGEGLKSPLPFRAAALAYAGFAAGQNRGVPSKLRLPHAKVISANETWERFASVRTEGLKGGGVWHDGLLKSHPRIIMAILRRAASFGAVCLNHSRATELLLKSGNESIGLRTMRGERAIDLKSATILNTCSTSTSGWARPLFPESSSAVNPALAFNIMLDLDPVSTHGVAVEPPEPNSQGERRTYFLVPRSGRIAAGTTHLHAPVPGEPLVTRAQVESMLTDLNAAIPSLGASFGHVLRVDAGLVPTVDPEGTEPSDRPRIRNHDADGIAGVTSAIAVKYTTARQTAILGLWELEDSWPGLSNRSARGAEAVKTEIPIHSLLIPRPSLDEILGNPDALKAFCNIEGVVTLSDLILGRTEWGEIPAHAMQIAEPLADLLADHFGWDAARKQAQLETLAHALPGSMPKMG